MYLLCFIENDNNGFTNYKENEYWIIDSLKGSDYFQYMNFVSFRKLRSINYCEKVRYMTKKENYLKYIKDNNLNPDLILIFNNLYPYYDFLKISEMISSYNNLGEEIKNYKSLFSVSKSDSFKKFYFENDSIKIITPKIIYSINNYLKIKNLKNIDNDNFIIYNINLENYFKKLEHKIYMLEYTMNIS